MTGAARPAPRIVYTDHLVGLVARAEASAARIAVADAGRRAAAVASARRESARLSARLDASPLDDATADEVDRREAEGAPPVDTLPPVQDTVQHGSWARALKLEGMPTQEVAAVEYANLLASHDVEPALADQVLDAPLDVLAELHAVICRGLVAPDVAGRPRRTEQAVHDGAHGRVLYHAPPPGAVPDLLAGLAGWLRTQSATLPALVVAGVVQERLLEWQPYEAANGRLARAFSRVMLRARGLDPHGLAVPEQRFAAEQVAYFAEVAATIRRRGDLVPWLERYAEAVCEALDDAAALLDVDAPTAALPQRAEQVVAGLGAGEAVTLAEYAERAAVSRAAARADLAALEQGGWLRVEPGTRGLRWRRR